MGIILIKKIKYPLHKMALKVGTKIPEATFRFLNAEGLQAKTTAELFAGKKAVVFGVPGAFTPTCSATHLPGFNETVAQFKSAGVDVVACVSVNDAFVLKSWGE